MLVVVGVSVKTGGSVVSMTSGVEEISAGVAVSSGVVIGTVGEGVSDGKIGGVSVGVDQPGEVSSSWRAETSSTDKPAETSRTRTRKPAMIDLRINFIGNYKYRQMITFPEMIVPNLTG